MCPRGTSINSKKRHSKLPLSLSLAHLVLNKNEHHINRRKICKQALTVDSLCGILLQFWDNLFSNVSIGFHKEFITLLGFMMKLNESNDPIY